MKQQKIFKRICTNFFLVLAVVICSFWSAQIAHAETLDATFSVQSDQTEVLMSLTDTSDTQSYTYTITFVDSSGKKISQTGAIGSGSTTKTYIAGLATKTTYSVTLEGVDMLTGNHIGPFTYTVTTGAAPNSNGSGSGSGSGSQNSTSSAVLANHTFTPPQNNQSIAVPAGASALCSTAAIPNGSGGGYTFPQCCNGIDDDSDGKADYYGTSSLPPDPKCLYVGDNESDICYDKNGVEVPSTSASCVSHSMSQIIPCTNKCTLEDVFTLINNIINFTFKYLLLPFIVLLFVYAGASYFMAINAPEKKVKLFKLLWRIVLGLVLILGAWLIVKTILLVLLDGSQDISKGAIQFFQ